MKRWILALTALALALSLVAMHPQVGLAQSNLARLRLVQTSPNSPSLDVLINGNTIFAGLEFKTVTPYALLTPGVSNVQLVPAGPNQVPVLNVNANLAACTDYTLVSVGLPGSIEPLLLLDDNSPPAPGQARLRFVHASPNAPAVDIAIAGGPVLFSNVQFKGVAGYASINAGTFTFEVRQAGTSNVLLTVPNVTLDNCTVSTLFAVGLLNGIPPLEAVSSRDADTGCAPPAATAVAPLAATVTPTRTPIPIVVPVVTATGRPVVTATPAVVTASPVATATRTKTPLITATATGTTAPTATGTVIPTLTSTPTETATATATGTLTPTTTASPAETATATGTMTPMVTTTSTETATPTVTATGTLTPTTTATPTETPTETPTPSPTPTETKTPQPETAVPTTMATSQPTEVPTTEVVVPATEVPTAKVVVPATEPPAAESTPVEAATPEGGGMGSSQGGFLMPTPWWMAARQHPW